MNYRLETFLKKGLGRFLLPLLLFLVLGRVLLVGETPLQPTDRQFIKQYKEADVIIKKSVVPFKRGNYEAAEKYLRQSLRVMPHHVNAHILLAQVLYQQENYEEALIYVSRAESDFNLLARTLMSSRHQAELNSRKEKRELQELLASCNGACTFSSVFQEAKAGILAMEANSHLAGADRVPTMVPAEFHYVHGNILYKLKRYKDAHHQYLAALERDPRHERAFNNVINLYYMAAQYDKSASFLAEAKKRGVRIDSRLAAAVNSARQRQLVAAAN